MTVEGLLPPGLYAKDAERVHVASVLSQSVGRAKQSSVRSDFARDTEKRPPPHTQQWPIQFSQTMHPDRVISQRTGVFQNHPQF